MLERRSLLCQGPAHKSGAKGEEKGARKGFGPKYIITAAPSPTEEVAEGRQGDAAKTTCDKEDEVH